jgi:hypothetical protein
MPLYSTDQRFVLHGYRLVPLASAKLVGVLNRLRKACLAGLISYMPAWPSAISAPMHRKSKKVKIARTFPAILISRRPPEIYQACLVRVKTQMEPLKSLTQDTLNPLGIIRALEANDEIITVSDQFSPTLQPRFHLLLEPLV